MILADSWSLGVLIGIPVLIVLALIFVAAILAARRSSDYDAPFMFYGGILGLVVVIAGGLIGFFPYSSQYHRWHTTSGVVQEVSSRFLGSGDNGTTQKFVVRINGRDSGEYGCNDTRCALVKKGDRLTLSCKRTWQFSGRDGWDCNFVERNAA